MSKTGSLALRLMINRFSKQNEANLLKFFHPDDREKFENLNISSNDLTPLLRFPQVILEKIHLSWIIPLLDHFPKSLHSVVLSTTNPEGQSLIRTKIPTPLSYPVKRYIQNQLFVMLKGRDHLPLEYLPENELTPLGGWSKDQLLTLIDFLGLYDLAAEVRHIVNRTHLNNILLGLSPKQRQFLKSCMHQREKIISPKLGIDPSKQDAKHVQQLIHRRGLVRLARALHDVHPDFVWFLAHILDVGRGKILLKNYQSPSMPNVTKLLKQQVLTVMNFLTSE